MSRLTLAIAGVAVLASSARGDDRDDVRFSRALAKTAAAVRQMEFTRMFTAVWNGSRMGAGDGWFKPSENHYSWSWLAERFDADKNGRISPTELPGAKVRFTRLDRDRDGEITAADLDWSESSPYWKQLTQAQQLLRAIDQDGKLTREEWLQLFDKHAQGKNYLGPDDVRALLNPPPRKPGPGGGGMPSKAVLLQGLLEGELGSMSEGPRLGRRAPDFTLVTHDGRRTVRLSDVRNQKPVVLIFGSFT
jgi:hypothetical protein